MTTTLDIIDTAVKIGLGAMISSIATYFALLKNHNQENQKDLRNTKKELLRDCSLKIEESTTIFNNAYNAIIFERAHSNGSHESISNENLVELTKVTNIAKDAKSIAYLLTENKLALLLEDFLKVITDITLHLKNHNTSYDNEYIKPKMVLTKSSIMELHKEFGKAFKRIYA